MRHIASSCNLWICPSICIQLRTYAHNIPRYNHVRSLKLSVPELRIQGPRNSFVGSHGFKYIADTSSPRPFLCLPEQTWDIICVYLCIQMYTVIYSVYMCIPVWRFRRSFESSRMLKLSQVSAIFCRYCNMMPQIATICHT